MTPAPPARTLTVDAAAGVITVGQLAEQCGTVEPQRVGDYLDDSLVADLIAVTERAVDDVAPPVLCQALNVRELVNQARGGKNPACSSGLTLSASSASTSASRVVTTSAVAGESWCTSQPSGTRELFAPG